MLTGLAPEQHGAIGENTTLARGMTSIPEILTDSGYQCAGFVSAYWLRRARGFAQGFGMFDERSERANQRFARAIRWLAGARQPFFLFVHTYDAHFNYKPDADYVRLFADPGYHGPIDGTFDALRPYFCNNGDLFRQRVCGLPEKDRQHLVDLYDASIRQVDHAIGEFLDAVNELGLGENTFVVVTADHGTEFLEHGGVNHATLYEEVLRVPFIVSAPPGRTVSEGSTREPIQLVDLVPMILRRAGIGAHTTFARSPNPWPPGSAIDSPGRRYPFFGSDARAVRDNNLKLVCSLNQRCARPVRANTVFGCCELFDLNVDPGEQVDRSVVDPDAVQRLGHLLTSLETPTAAPIITGFDDKLATELRAIGYILDDVDGGPPQFTPAHERNALTQPHQNRLDD
jgi:arylsulfatase A-like enzyme